MGASLSSRQVPQVRALAALLETNNVRVSVRQLQRYWDLLLPFNPWLATCTLWSPKTYETLIARVTSAMEHERKQFPPGLIPALVAICACLQGVPSPAESLVCAPSEEPPPTGPDLPDDCETHSLSAQLEAALELDPPAASDSDAEQDGELLPSSSSKQRKSPAAPDKHGALPPSPMPSSRLYPPLPVQSTSGPTPENAWPPSSAKPEAPSAPSFPPPDRAAPPSLSVPGNDATAPPSWRAPAGRRDQSTAPPLPASSRNSPYNCPPFPAVPPSYASQPPSYLYPGAFSPWATPQPPFTSDDDDPGDHPNMPQPDADGAFLRPPTAPLADMFPLNPVRSPANPQIWIPFSPKDMQALRTAIKEDGLASPHVQDILERMAVPRCVPYDWITLAWGTLTPGQFVDWRTHFGSFCETQIAENARAGITFPANAFLGHGRFTQPQAYIGLPPGFFVQLRECALRAFRSCAASAPEPLTKLFQKPEEPFNDFVARVQAAAEHKVIGAQAQTSFIKDLLQEGANPACKAIIRLLRDKPLHDWVLACSGVSSQASAMAAAVVAAVQASNQCFRCGELGHYARECTNRPVSHPVPEPPGPPATARAPRLPSTPCPCCGKGYHWARDCRATNPNCQPLNGHGGKAQPRNQEAPPDASVPTRHQPRP
ncbi:endogenous retrovirus group K member 24 Gag polyprotein-like [Dasypus novemcinctus]|uniref:endogenous retrovirus group K member 24 Gag polyprotein-like n=1 Tax=Dasypus novemcinctus TaxID=9361 RepID=UPI00265E4EA0|nr:endogenous retrovirus group K member 24 Gag polyprotein-like [Dasypus novemcinctus]